MAWLGAVSLVLGLMGCGPTTSSGDTPGSTRITGADLSGTGPGSLIEATAITNVDQSVPLGTTSARVIYRSTSGIDGAETSVSGAVFIPPGRPPQGGWPVVAFAHGTSGFNSECGPSLSPDLMGGIGTVVRFLNLGFAVAAADYQGLGMPGAHPYLDAKTAGFNVIDSVRAAQALSGDVSGTWGAVGGSQGGAAAWAANEQALTYAPELRLVGTVSMVPAADLSDFAAAAAEGVLNRFQMAMYIGILRGFERTRPGFPIDDYRQGLVEQKWEVLNACAGADAEERVGLLDVISPADLVPSTPDAQQRLYDLLAAMALPQRQASAPMMVIYAGQDEYVPAATTKTALDRSCALGDQIFVVFQPDRSHGTVDTTIYDQWLGERFAGLPVRNNC